MINQQSELQSSFALHIHSANIVLNCSLEDIKQMFAENEMYDADYIFKEKTEKYLEIRFPNTSLTCVFDEKNLCTMSLLFLDNLEDLNEYVSCINHAYTYDYLRKEWQTPTGTVSISTQKEDTFFVFC